MADGFKTMVKMMTDEMSVIDKSRKNANTTKMASTDFTTGYQMYKKGGTVKKAAGGAMGAMEDSAKMRMAMKGMAKKQKPMGGRPMPSGMAAATPPMASSIPAMKKGGKMAMKDGGMPMKMKDGEKVPAFLRHGGKAMMGGGQMTDKEEKMDKKVHKHEGAMHPGKPLTKLKKGGKAAYASGGVVMDQAGFKDGGDVKKHFATGGKVVSGSPVAMPQGKKKPNPPVEISKLAGTY